MTTGSRRTTSQANLCWKSGSAELRIRKHVNQKQNATVAPQISGAHSLGTYFVTESLYDVLSACLPGAVLL